VSPLLRELLLKATAFEVLYPQNGREARLIAALLDELSEAPVEYLHLPMPRDLRLRQLAQGAGQPGGQDHDGRMGPAHWRE
jgi:hypothetical protein